MTASRTGGLAPVQAERVFELRGRGRTSARGSFENRQKYAPVPPSGQVRSDARGLSARSLKLREHSRKIRMYRA